MLARWRAIRAARGFKEPENINDIVFDNDVVQDYFPRGFSEQRQCEWSGQSRSEPKAESILDLDRSH
jgi:hypothetical protein